MKRSHGFAALGITAVIAFFAGRATSGNGADTAAGAGGSGSGKASRFRASDRDGRTRPDSGNGSTARLRREIESSPPDSLAPLVYRVMEIGDPILRRQLLYDLFARMDAGNFQAMTDEFPRLVRETGRDNYDEWLLIHTRAGQVAGASAMERWNQPGMRTSDQAWRTLWGWASVDPDAAAGWLNGQASITPEERQKLLTALTSATLVRDQEKAFRLMDSLTETERIACIPQFTSHLIQNAGKEGAIDWMAKVNAAQPDSDYAKKVTERVFDRVVWSGANQKDASTMASEFARLSTVIPITEDWIVRGMGQIRDRRSIGGIELLDAIARNSALQDVPLGDRAWNSAVKFAMERDNAAVGEWLTRNTTSPIHGRVARMYSERNAPEF